MLLENVATAAAGPGRSILERPSKATCTQELRIVRMQCTTNLLGQHDR
jgi:hypothetical protein